MKINLFNANVSQRQKLVCRSATSSTRPSQQIQTGREATGAGVEEMITSEDVRRRRDEEVREQRDAGNTVNWGGPSNTPRDRG